MKMKKVITGAAALTGFVTLGQAANADEIVVQAGDTVSELALKHGTTVEAIQQANKLQDPNLIFVGQRLEVGNNVSTNSSQTQQAQATQQAQTQTQQQTQPVQQQAQAQSQQTQTTQPQSTVSGDEASAKAWIANVESGGSYTARNGQYIGKYQLTSSYLGGDYSAENQERVADNYVQNRYGSWQAAKSFWLANGWY